MELVKEGRKASIKFNYAHNYSPSRFDGELYLVKARPGTLSVTYEGPTDGPEYIEFEMSYRTFEDALDDFLDGEVGDGFRIKVKQRDYGDTTLSMEHLANNRVRIIGPCGLNFFMQYEELDAIYGAMPDLR